MFFKEYLRSRRALVVYGIVWASLFVLTGVLAFIVPMGVDPDQALAHHAGGVGTEPWPDLIAFSAFMAAVLATVLGSVLSQENDGHLEFALTRPYSRSAYAAAVIGVDVAAILAAVLIGVAFSFLHFLLFHQPGSFCCEAYQFVNGPDPFSNVLRYLLFPVAWYAIIVAASATLRSAGIVQAMIWPVLAVTAALRGLPERGMFAFWHQFFVAVNVFNPLVLGTATDSGTQVIGGGYLAPALSALILLAIAVAGYLAALAQWRRVEA